MTPRPLYKLRNALLKIFGADLAAEVRISQTANIFAPWNLSIGEYSSVGDHARIYNLATLTIGSNSTISQSAHLCGGSHDYNSDDMQLIKSPIVVGDNAWVCADAFVGPGVKVGDFAIVAARSVVTKDVEANTIVGGNPAKLIKSRPSAANEQS